MLLSRYATKSFLSALFLSTALGLVGCGGGDDVLPPPDEELPPPACGDGVLNEGEVCDDGNTANGDGCRADCSKEEVCGDGILDAGEECDDGDTANNDGCDDECFIEEVEDICGDGILGATEVCDDGNTAGGDGCSANCDKIEACGDGILDAGEVCDDGNTVSGDGCRADCDKVEICGDGVLDVGEECDDSNLIDADGCEADCTLPACENGIVDPDEFCFSAPQEILAANQIIDVVFGDIDQDGDLDLVEVTGFAGTQTVKIHENNLGAFSLATTLNGIFARAGLFLASADADGDVDLVSAGGTSVSFIEYISDLLFAPPNNTTFSQANIVDAEMGDIDGDGDLDLVVANKAFNGISSIKNNGNGFFSGQINTAIADDIDDIALGDLDNDGDLDAVTANGSEFSISISKNNGSGAFAAPITLSLGNEEIRNVRILDLNDDGKLDVVANAFDGQGTKDRLVILPNFGNAVLIPLRSVDGIVNVLDFEAIDFDFDGKLDLVAAEAIINKVSFFKNKGLDTFEFEKVAVIDIQTNEIVVEDINQDGTQDLALVTNKIELGAFGRAVKFIFAQP